MAKSRGFFFLYLFFIRAEENSRLFQTFHPQFYFFPGFSRPGISKIEIQAFLDFSRFCRHPVLVGYPIIKSRDFDYKINSYFGIAKLKILTPEKFYQLSSLANKKQSKNFLYIGNALTWNLNSHCRAIVEERAIAGKFYSLDCQKSLGKRL